MNPAAFHDLMATAIVSFGGVEYSLTEALEGLDALAQRGGESAQRAMRSAAAIIDKVVLAFLEKQFGYASHETAGEPEHLKTDPANIDRHLIVTSSLSLLVGDGSFPTLAAKWLGIGASTEQQAAFYEALLSGRRVEAVVRKDAPATAIRSNVRGSTADAERVRRQRRDPASFSSLDAVRTAEGLPPSAEFCVAARVAVDFAPLIKRLRLAGYARLADTIEVFLSIDRNHKGTMGNARYQYLLYHMPLVRSFAEELGMQPLSSKSFPRFGVTSPSTWFWDDPARSRVAHRYTALELEIYRAVMIDGLPFAAA